MKKIRINTTGLITIFFFTLLSCNPLDLEYNTKLKITNNSENRIYFNWRSDYPDTSLSITNPNWVGPYNNLPWSENGLNPGETKSLKIRGSWEDCFDKHIPSDTIIIYFIDAEILERVYWETILKDYMILRRYDLSIKDLENKNWTITYP